MANTPNPGTPGRRDSRGTVQPSIENDVPLGSMQEPFGSNDRPVPRNSADFGSNAPGIARDASRGTSNSTFSDDTLARDAETMRDGAYRDAGPVARSGRGFTATFAIAAVVLLMAFLVALYFGSQNSDVATAPTATQESLTENAPANGSTPGTVIESGDTTGSTTAPAVPPASVNDGAPSGASGSSATTP